jgi:aspartate aminotransferase-like enzyme
VALEHIRQKGLEALFTHTALLSKATRLAFEGVGLELLAKDAPSPALTGVILPDGVPGEKLVKALRDQAGITFAGGQDKFKGKAVRMAHIGYLSELDTLLAIAALEIGLARFGVRVEPGKAVGIAEQAFLEAGFLKEV